MNKETVLQQFGLTEAEVRLYIELLKLGETTASELAKHTNTNRTFTYDRLKKLLETGLTSYTIKDTKKYFKATDPSHLLAILKEKETQVQAILPELRRLKNPVQSHSKVEIYSSLKGIKTALNTTLKTKTIFIQGSLQKFRKTMGSYFEIWNQRRINEKIHTLVLTNEDEEISQARIELLSGEEESAITTFICNNTVIIISWSDTPFALYIESEEFFQEQKTVFENIWNREIKIYEGVHGIIKAWMDLVSEKTHEIVGYGLSWQFAEIYSREKSDTWHALRLKNNIRSKFIAYDESKTKKYFDVRMLEWKKFEIKSLPREYCGPSCVAVTDNAFAQFFYGEKKYRTIVSKNKEMIAAYKKHFATLWKKAQ